MQSISMDSFTESNDKMPKIIFSLYSDVKLQKLVKTAARGFQIKLQGEGL